MFEFVCRNESALISPGFLLLVPAQLPALLFFNWRSEVQAIKQSARSELIFFHLHHHAAPRETREAASVPWKYPAFRYTPRKMTLQNIDAETSQHNGS